MPPPELSVVLPTRDRPAALRRSLAAVVEACRASGRAFEVIVVDDGPDATPAAAVHAINPGLRGTVRYVAARDHGGRGPGDARNLGVMLAQAPIIAFTDDDTRCDRGWVCSALSRFDAEPTIAGVEGAVLPAADDEIASTRSRVVHNAVGGGYLTANLFVRRSALVAVGGFRPMRFPFREDTDLGLRVVEAVGPIPFDPTCVVWHSVQDVPLIDHLKTALYFTVDEAFIREHPGAVPGISTQPFARARIRLACLAFACALLIPVKNLRKGAIAGVLVAASLTSLQVEHDLRSFGIRRDLRQVARAALLRLPRSLAWVLIAGAARAWGFIMTRCFGRRLPEPSLSRFTSAALTDRSSD